VDQAGDPSGHREAELHGWPATLEDRVTLWAADGGGKGMGMGHWGRGKRPHADHAPAADPFDSLVSSSVTGASSTRRVRFPPGPLPECAYCGGRASASTTLLQHSFHHTPLSPHFAIRFCTPYRCSSCPRQRRTPSRVFAPTLRTLLSSWRCFIPDYSDPVVRWRGREYSKRNHSDARCVERRQDQSHHRDCRCCANSRSLLLLRKSTVHSFDRRIFSYSPIPFPTPAALLSRA